MHFKNTVIVLLFALIAVSACDSPSQNAENENETENPTTVEESPPKPTAEEQSLTNVVDNYLLLKDALVASNPQEAQTRSTNMLEFIDATNMMGVQQSAKQIAAATDIETQRAYFDSLSVYLYDFIESKTGEERTLYKQYCPMAFDNRGAYWLSNTKEIRNPYFGDEMLTCGRMEETLTY